MFLNSYIMLSGFTSQTIQSFAELEATLEPDYSVAMPSDMNVTIENNDFSVTIEKELNVEICTRGY